MTCTDSESKNLPCVAATSLVVGDNGSTLAWWARPGKEGSEWFCYVNGKAVGSTSTADVSPWWHDIVLAPDGKRIAYVVSDFSGEGENRKNTGYQIWVDGKPGSSFMNVGKVVFSPDSKRYAHLASLGNGKGMTYVVDGQPEAETFESIWGFTFSADSKHYAYVAEDEGNLFVISYDGQVYPTPLTNIYSFVLLSNGLPQYFGKKNGQVFSVQGLYPKND